VFDVGICVSLWTSWNAATAITDWELVYRVAIHLENLVKSESLRVVTGQGKVMRNKGKFKENVFLHVDKVLHMEHTCSCHSSEYYSDTCIILYCYCCKGRYSVNILLNVCYSRGIWSWDWRVYSEYCVACVGPFGVSAEWVRSSWDTADRQRITTTPCRGFSSQSNDRPLLSPARFIPATSEPNNSIRPPSKWSPVLSGCNTNDLSFRSSKTGVSILCFSWLKNEMCYCAVAWYVCITTRAGQWC